VKGFLIVIVLVAAGVVGLGFYLGWFRVSSGGGGGESNVTLTVDTDKIQEDANKAQEKVHDLGHRVKEPAATGKATTPTEKSKDPAAPPVQPPRNPE
jgi:hypothetical protein